MHSQHIGRFDKSFVVRMLRDFFLRRLKELRMLENRMADVARNGQHLLDRLAVRPDED